MKRVLIITYYWPPAGGGGVQRWVKFAAYLRSFGWEPIIYTVKDGDYPITDPSMEQEVPSGLEIIRLPILEPYTLYQWFLGKPRKGAMDANFLSQGKKLGWKDKIAVWIRGNFFIPDARFLWVRPSVQYLLKYIQKSPVDAIISTGPPHSCHLIAQKLHAKHKIPWLVDYRDPWTQIDYFDDLNLTPIARKRHESMEKSVLDECSAIVTVGQTMADDLKSITQNRTIVITNGFDESDRPEGLVQPDEAFTLTYIGTMNAARNPEVIWKAVSELKTIDHPLIQTLKIRLVGKPEFVIKENILKYGLENLVEFTGYVTHKEAIKFQNSSWVLLLVINRTSNNASILTGKIFEYLASGRPVLCIGPTKGDAASILRQAGSGHLFDYEDTDGVKQYLIHQFGKFQEKKFESTTGRITGFSRRNLTEKLAALLDELCDISKNGIGR